MAATTHLDWESTPGALAILDKLVGCCDRVPAGYEGTVDGAWVDWDMLIRSPVLSSGEIAAVHIARGCVLAERIGGLPLRSKPPVLTAIEQVIHKR
jgi:hypothetical protein